MKQKCPSGKRVYSSEALAEDALLEAHIQFDYRPGYGPIAVYRCEDCGQFHLTSKGTMNTRLAESIRNGYLKKQRDSIRWEQQFKK